MLVGLWACAVNGATPIDWPQLQFTEVASGLVGPSQIIHAGDGSGRLFIVEQQGVVRILQSGNLLPTPFLDISNRVGLWFDRALLSIAFPPDFASKGCFYAHYNRVQDGASVVSRFTLSTNANIADKRSEQVLLVVPSAGEFENGGPMAFGPDGYLYIALGESENSSLPQNPGSLRGKILRIDVEGDAQFYRVPASNPLVGQPAYRPEIWALGLRNPLRLAFDRLSGDMYIGDSDRDGEDLQEINFQPASSSGGENYGWPLMLGQVPWSLPPGVLMTNQTPPVTSYNSAGGQVIGGVVVRNPGAGRMDGMYFFCDIRWGYVWCLKHDGSAWQSEVVARSGHSISAFGEDESGQLYVTDCASGQILSVQDSGIAAPPKFDPPGPVAYDTTIRLNCLTADALIHYTIDGRDPTESDPAIMAGGAIACSPPVTIKAASYRTDLLPSVVVSNLYTERRVAAPAFTLSSEVVTNGTLLTLDCATLEAVIRYATNENPIGPSSPVYSEPFVITGPTFVKAQAFRAGFLDSESTMYYCFGLAPVATPTFSPMGSITNGTPVTITCTTPGSTIRYTLDGSVPDMSSPMYTAPVCVDIFMTLNAIAYSAGYNPSAMRSFQYQPPGIWLEYNPPPGPITNGTQIFLTANLPGADIHYETNGSFAGRTSMLYSNSITLKGNTFLSAGGYFTGIFTAVIMRHFYSLLLCEATKVTTVAGNGLSTYSDGQGLEASFFWPKGICMDASNNLYVADSGNFRVRKISPNGEVTTLAGEGGQGSLDGLAADAEFSFLSGICLDTSGNVYVSDSGNAKIRKITPNGIVTCYATGGLGLGHLEMDSRTNLYANDSGQIVKILSDGTVTSVSPNSFFSEAGLALDVSNKLFVASSRTVFGIPSNGPTEVFIETSWPLFCLGCSGVYFDGDRNTAGFVSLRGAAVDLLGNVYVADGNWIRKIRPDGRVASLAGTGTAGYQDGDGPAAQFNAPSGLCVDGRGNVYVADTGNHRIRKIIQLDWDDDGIPDAEEGGETPYVVGIDDRWIDSDGDGQSNAAEYLAGTDPLDPSSVLAIRGAHTNTDGQILFHWPAVLGRTYQVQGSADLITWTNVGFSMAGSGALQCFTNNLASPFPCFGFYRIRVTKP